MYIVGVLASSPLVKTNGVVAVETYPDMHMLSFCLRFSSTFLLVRSSLGQLLKTITLSLGCCQMTLLTKEIYRKPV